MPLSPNINNREFEKFLLDQYGETAVRTILAGAVPQVWDEIDLSYTGDDLTTVVFKLQSATITTLTLTWTGGNLTNVLRS